jgi:acyl-CoA synthetase (AMP-forming)/AMP-acid ligase II
MVGSGEIQSYAELDARSNQLAHLFRDAGLQRGDHMALFMENQIHYMEIVWAALRSGIYITAINSYLTAPEVAYIIDDCEAKLVVTSAAKAAVANEIDTSTTPRVERWLMADLVAGTPFEDYDTAIAAFPTTAISDESPGTSMLYSSGTTGRPKGIKRPLPAHAIDEMDPRTAANMQTLFGYRQDMTYLSPAPMYHAAPLAFVTPVHRLGGTVVIMEKFDPVEALRAIERHSVTHSQWVPTMFIRMLKLDEPIRTSFDLSSLEVAIHAAAPCPVPVKRQMIEWWGPVLLEYYAGTEGNGSTFINSEQWLQKPGSVGQAPPGTLHICDPDGTELPAGEEGGVYFSGGAQFEYHNAPEKTADATLPGGRTTLGDIGYLDEDGFLFLTDRKAHMIISGGVNIYPREIEDLLIAHPSVADVAVFGVPDPDMGEQVKAVIQPAAGIDIEGDAGDRLAGEIMEYARAGLAHYKCPKSVDFEAELPRLPTGKLYKRILRDRYWGKSDSTIV